jgi:hypothetical protein
MGHAHWSCTEQFWRALPEIMANAGITCEEYSRHEMDEFSYKLTSGLGTVYLSGYSVPEHPGGYSLISSSARNPFRWFWDLRLGRRIEPILFNAATYRAPRAEKM